jgi:LAO/AO transport system kinase
MADSTDPARLAQALLAGDRAALARAITLVESRRADHRDKAQRLLAAVLPRAGGAARVGVSGVPGAGKSTLIDALGVMLTGRGRRVAVLAVDPSSARTGGSILGDKTRMARLAVDPNAFVRPSPAAGTLGGVAARTRETILLVEAAGFDTVIVETVGVGQSETAVAGMVDTFLVVMAPATGDDLQGIKKGILELADIVAVNKADGDTRQRALRAVADYRAALHILTPPGAPWTPPVLAVSGLEGTGLDELWGAVEAHRGGLALDDKRAGQRVAALRARFEERLVGEATARPAVAQRFAALEREVREGRAPVEAAVEELLKLALS